MLRQEELYAKKLQQLTRDLMTMEPTCKEEKDKMYKNIIIFTVVAYGMGNPNQYTVLREAQAALYSVFKYTDLDAFVVQEMDAKEEYLYDLAKLTAGIRLYNRDAQRGGESIDDLPVLLSRASLFIRDRINKTLSQLDDRITEITKAVDIVYLLTLRNVSSLPEDDFSFELPAGVTWKDVDRIRKCSFLMHEQEFYLKKLIFVIEETILSIESLVEKFRETLSELHNVVRYRSAIPTGQVFPLFIILSNIWEDFQKEVAVLSEINNHYNFINNFRLESIEDLKLNIILNDVSGRPMHMMETPGTIGDINPRDLAKGVTIIEKADDDLLEQAQYSGFCAWTLSVTDGFLIPADPSIGYLRYNHRIYAFANHHVALAWGKHPESFIENIYRVARANLELVKILNLYEDLFLLRMEPMEKEEVVKIIRNTVYVQTELHPIRSNIDVDYTFSLWDYKRKALQLSRSLEYKTRSQQTTNSHFRANFGVQVGKNKTKSTQTMRDKGCNHDSPAVYHKGLRGLEDDFETFALLQPDMREIQIEEKNKHHEDDQEIESVP
ncbi:UNVERIFIED_CONTAM: hypothetical protein PYX00_004147 [Menopon gallinae]|uniref:Cilia- and flagella-associated protein 206 n=1 Tax=Menopon gallinae TaxID=328185 RepID=A0AAW2I4H3_9NEOP